MDGHGTSGQIRLTLRQGSYDGKISEEAAKGVQLCVSRNSRLLEILQEYASQLWKQGIRAVPDGHCNGRGSCGKCRVHFLTGAPLPSHADRLHLSADELRKGIRLSCTAGLVQDCEVVLCWEKASRMTVVMEADVPWQSVGANQADCVDGVPGTGEQHEGADEESGCFVAVDIGTTTVAMQLAEASSGKILATHCFMNPGRIYGADIVSRIQAACSGSLKQMQGELQSMLTEGIHILLDAVEGNAKYVVCAGNTAMEHILEGDGLEGMRTAPFDAGNISLRELEMDGYRVILMPGVSAFVGADIVAGVYACGMQQAEKPCLYLDLGTNGEMVLGCRGRMLATAVAAGPAFEGNVTAGVYGADMTAMIAGLLQRGILDRTGLLQEPYFQTGIELDGIRLTQQNVREFQLAKAAVRCGVEELLEAYGIEAEEVEHVYLAGGFGYFLKEEDALCTGILPREFAGRVISVGNAALAGAVRFGRLQDEELSRLAESIAVINLAEQEQFGEHYLSLLDLHMNSLHKAENKRM